MTLVLAIGAQEDIGMHSVNMQVRGALQEISNSSHIRYVKGLTTAKLRKDTNFPSVRFHIPVDNGPSSISVKIAETQYKFFVVHTDKLPRGFELHTENSPGASAFYRGIAQAVSKHGYCEIFEDADGVRTAVALQSPADLEAAFQAVVDTEIAELVTNSLEGNPKAILAQPSSTGPAPFDVFKNSPGGWLWCSNWPGMGYSAECFPTAAEALDDAWDTVLTQMATDRDISLKCLVGDSPEKFYFEDISRLVRQYMVEFGYSAQS